MDEKEMDRWMYEKNRSIDKLMDSWMEVWMDVGWMDG